MGVAILDPAGVLYKVLSGEALPRGLTPYLFGPCLPGGRVAQLPG